MKKKRLLFVLPAAVLALGACTPVEGGGQYGPDQPGPVQPTEKTLDSISVKSQPTKTEYLPGEAFDPAGLAIELHYSDGSKADADMSKVVYGEMPAATGNLTVSYVEGGVSKSTVVAVTIKTDAALQSVTIEGELTKTEYEVGEAFSTAGLSIVGHYSDGSTAALAGEIEVDPEVAAKGVTSITVSATVSGITATKTLTVTVNSGDVPPVIDVITPEDAKALMDEAGEGVVVEELKKVKGICAANSKYDSQYDQWTTGFEGVENFKLQFTDTEDLLGGESPDGLEIVVEGYLEKYQGKYQLSYLPASASPTGEKFTPNLISATAVEHEGVLESITVSEAHRELYKDGAFTGETVTAHYSDGSTAVVTATFSGYDMSAAGEQTVNVSYTEKGVTVTTSYKITVSERVVGETISPEQAMALMDTAGEGVVVEGLQKVKGICAANSQYDSKYGQYTTGFEGVQNFKLQFTDNDNILNGGSPDGMEIVVEGYLEKYQGKYQLSYLPASASPTGDKFTPNLVSAEAVAPVEIDHIEIEGSMSKTVYDIGEAFSSNGLSVKVVDKEGGTKIVSGSFEFTPAIAAADTKEVSVIAKYSDNYVSEPKTFTVGVRPAPTGEIEIEKELAITSASLNLAEESVYNSSSNANGFAYTDIFGTTEFIQGNHRAASETKTAINSELHNAIPFSKAITKIDFEMASSKTIGPDVQLSLFTGDSASPTGNKIVLGKGGEALVQGKTTTVTLATPAKFFSLKWEAYASYFTSITFHAEEGDVPPVTKEITSIVIDGDMTKKTYTTVDSWNSEGLSVVATYSDTTTGTLEAADYKLEFTPGKPTEGLESVSVVAKLVANEQIVSEPKEVAGLTVTQATAQKGTLENPYTVAELLEAYKDLPVYDSSSDEGKNKCFSDERVYVQGTITGDAPSTPQYTLDSDLAVYKPAVTTTFERPCKGDVAIFEGYVEHFTSGFELASNASHDGAPTCVSIISRGTSTVSLHETSSANATVTFEASVTNAADYSFTVAAKEGYQISCVKIIDTIRKDGAVLEGKDGVYSTKIYGNAKILVETVEEGQKVPTTISTTTSDLVTANGWNVSSGNDMNGIYNSFNLDNNISVSTSGEANCGSVWGTSPSNEWRLYQNKSGDVTITAAEGYKIVSIKLTFSISNTGALFDGDTQVESNTEYTVDGSSITLVVGNTGTKTNGQVRITGWVVVYIAE